MITILIKRAHNLRVMSSIPIWYVFLGVILEGEWARQDLRAIARSNRPSLNPEAKS